MNYSEIKRRISNPGERCFYSHVYAICNEFGPIAFVNANNDQDALDQAVDSGHMDCMAMSDEDHAEYEAKGWDDSYICAGNASEPFWS
jgi:hypothetical protein